MSTNVHRVQSLRETTIDEEGQKAMAGLPMRSATICLVTFLGFCGYASALASQKGGPEYPLLMPKVHPEGAESYLCTPIRIDEDTR